MASVSPRYEIASLTSNRSVLKKEDVVRKKLFGGKLILRYYEIQDRLTRRNDCPDRSFPYFDSLVQREKSARLTVEVDQVVHR